MRDLRFRNEYPPEWKTLKDEVREQTGNRCVRCGHPYRKGEHGNGEWSRCDDLCRHGGPVRWSNGSSWEEYDGPDETIAQYVDAKWRILTVHHLDGDKANCRWWNLAPLCQRCHLTIQGRVLMARVWPWEHSDWFKPYVAGYYAWVYLNEELSCDEVEARLDELLSLERVANEGGDSAISGARTQAHGRDRDGRDLRAEGTRARRDTRSQAGQEGPTERIDRANSRRIEEANTSVNVETDVES